MSETIVVEVAGKFGPKVNGKWMGVKRPLKATDFVTGQTYRVATEDWATGSKSGVNITAILEEGTPAPEVSKQTVSKTATSPTTTNAPVLNYEDQKNRRILRQGIVQAVAQSPMLAGLPFTNANEVVALVKEVSNQLIEFVQE